MTFRMIQLYTRKKEILESSGLKYKMSFFDVVFERIKKERY